MDYEHLFVIMTKPFERAQARRLRQVDGMPIKRIAALLGVSPSSVHKWTADIELSPEHRHRNLYGPKGPQNPEHIAARVRAWSERNRDRRRKYQEEGRAQARLRDPLHLAGCMLYWAEGSKSRNTLGLANSDPHLVRFFCSFIRRCFRVPDDDFTMRLHVYLGNGLTIEEIERHWLTELLLPASVLRKHAINALPTSSSGLKKNKLPYGVCTLRVQRSTWLVQHIFGADPGVRRVRATRLARLSSDGLVLR